MYCYAKGEQITAIYGWNGVYFGFINNGRLFNATPDYLGWVTDDGRVWRKNGTFLGEIENRRFALVFQPLLAALAAISCPSIIYKRFRWKLFKS
jgi:hypothetical protein